MHKHYVFIWKWLNLINRKYCVVLWRMQCVYAIWKLKKKNDRKSYFQIWLEKVMWWNSTDYKSHEDHQKIHYNQSDFIQKFTSDRSICFFFIPFHFLISCQILCRHETIDILLIHWGQCAPNHHVDNVWNLMLIASVSIPFAFWATR